MLFYRGPLASAFKLHIQDIALFQNSETGQDMDHLCLRTDGLAEKYKHNIIMTKMLPDYGCLMLSPANLWQKDPRAFQMDSNVISTVFNFQVRNTFISLCSRNFQNVKLRLDFVEIWSFYRHSDFTWNQILLISNGPKMSFLAILETVNLEFW